MVSHQDVLLLCSVARSCPALCNPTDCSTPGSPLLHRPPEFARILSIESVMVSTHLILCRPLLLLPSVFPTARFFSSESALPIRWPEYWSFSFSISPSSEYSGLVSSRMDWFDLLAAQGTLCVGYGSVHHHFVPALTRPLVTTTR